MLEILGSRELVFDDGSFLTAASGLVECDGYLVVSDERPVIGRFTREGPRARIVLSEEALPEDPAQRKEVKPDLEAIARLPGGDVVVLGSGSTERRERGWILPRQGSPSEISLAGLYGELRDQLDDLNIEGAACTPDGSLWLAQRGNGAEGVNAVAEISWEAFAVRSLQHVDLPAVEGVPLTLTDLGARDDGSLLFTAVAEDVASTYHDGPCVGAAIGVLDPRSGVVLHLEVLEEPMKVEGIVEGPDGLHLVVDPDDSSVPGLMLDVRWAP